MMNIAEPTVEAQPAIQLLAASSSRTSIPGAWQKPSPASVTSAESSSLHSPLSHRAANLIVTLGPATKDGGTIRKLIKAGDETVAAAVRRADECNADAIIFSTQSGRSAALCAALRPRRSRVIAFTPDTRLVRRLMLHGAIEPQALSFSDQSKKTVRAAEKLLLEKRILSLGTRLVVVTETQDEDQRVSSVQERTLEKV